MVIRMPVQFYGWSSTRKCMYTFFFQGISREIISCMDNLRTTQLIITPLLDYPVTVVIIHYRIRKSTRTGREERCPNPGQLSFTTTCIPLAIACFLYVNSGHIIRDAVLAQKLIVVVIVGRKETRRL